MSNLNKDQQNLEEEMKKTSCINICRYYKSFKRTSRMVRRAEKNYFNYWVDRIAKKVWGITWECKKIR